MKNSMMRNRGVSSVRVLVTVLSLYAMSSAAMGSVLTSSWSVGETKCMPDPYVTGARAPERGMIRPPIIPPIPPK
jgi:hypothetical protein